MSFYGTVLRHRRLPPPSTGWTRPCAVVASRAGELLRGISWVLSNTGNFNALPAGRVCTRPKVLQAQRLSASGQGSQGRVLRAGWCAAPKAALRFAPGQRWRDRPASEASQRPNATANPVPSVGWRPRVPVAGQFIRSTRQEGPPSARLDDCREVLPARHTATPDRCEASLAYARSTSDSSASKSTGLVSTGQSSGSVPLRPTASSVMPVTTQ